MKFFTLFPLVPNCLGRLLSVNVDKAGTKIDLLAGDDLTIKLNGTEETLTA